MQHADYQVLAYYLFTPLQNPEEEVRRHHAFFEGRDIKCRIYISSEGINGQLCGIEADAEAYKRWLLSDKRFENIVFKVHRSPIQVFPRATVKVRKQLVALDTLVDLSLTGERVSPAEWKKMLQEKDEHTVVLDVRNDYEWVIGHFEGAKLPPKAQFREFPAYAKDLKETADPEKTKVMMYCTGGIRCELFSAFLKQEGFKHVYQLEGGIIQYGLSEGNDLWHGKLFVFDDRLSVPLSEEEPSELISSCTFCEEKTDLYFNCANVDCNELFLSCHACAAKFKGCCCEECTLAPRVRAFEPSERPRPYRRLSAEG